MKNKGIRNRIDTSGGKTRKIALRSAIALSVALIVALIFFFAEDRVYAAEETVAVSEYSVTGYSDGSPLQITSAEDLRRFSNWYSQHAAAQGLGNRYFSLDLQLAGSTYWNLYSTEYTYTSIGTASNPFWGKIKITGTNVNIFYSPVPLFGYLNQKTSFVDSDGNLKQIILLCSEKDNENKASSVPLLASHVVNPGSDGTAFSANVTIGYFDSSWDDYTNSTAKSFAGIIGEIGTGSDTTKVSLTVTNNGTGLYSANVANPSGAVGLLCQKINAGSELSATLNAGTNTNYSVTASGSNNYAGGLVGAMYNESKLTLSGTGLNTVMQSVSGTNAGGIVGYAENAYIDSETSDSDGSMTITPVFKAASTTLSGTSGNGYLFGYYRNTAGARKIKLSGFTGLTVSSTTQNAGGLVGVLVHNPSPSGVAFTIDGTAGVASGASITQNLTATFSGSNNCGGAVGKYSTNNLLNTLVITDVYAKVANGNSATTGGIIGYVDDSSSAAYIELSKIYAHRTSGSSGGGLVGNAGNTNAKGAFINVSGYNKVQGSFGAGLVNTINRGVLRIEGVTDLSSLSEGNYIVSSRNSALVYSPGTGNQAGTSAGEWRLIRQGHIADDIGSWGEVVRLNGFTANSVIDETNYASVHSVTLTPAAISGINNVTAFALLALNIQHNTTDTSAALVCSGTKSASLLGSTIDFASSSGISLAGTGIMGLTRDNGTQTFTGTINGNGSTVTLAIGEAYGVDGSGNAVSNSNSSNAGTGKIYNHQYNGLLAVTSGATVNDLTVNGTQWMGLISSMCFGGITAQSNGGDTFDNVTSDVTVNVKQQLEITDANNVAFGGFMGRTNKAASGTILFKDCATTSDFNDNTYNSVTVEAGTYNMESCFGGYIGLVDCDGDNANNNALTISFGTSGGTTPCAVGGSYTSVYSSPLNSVYGGLIGIVKGNYVSHGNDKRTVNAYAVTVDGLAVNSKTNKASGGLLGYVWHDAEVYLQNVTVGGTSANTVTISGGSGKILTGLVYSATGHWSVDNVSIDRVTFTTPNSNSSLGLLVNSTVNDCMLLIDSHLVDVSALHKHVYSYSNDKDTGLLLELINQGHYVVTGTGNLSIDNDVAVFDEIAAYSKHPDNDDVCDNGNSVISINTDGSGTGVTMTGSSCNTYQNQSDYGKNTVTVNPNTRYYYNLDTIRAKGSPSDAEKLLLWSLSKYALEGSVSKYFDGTESGASVSTISGDLDMAGLSYYPVDYSSVNFDTITHLKFYNEEIETAEGLSGNGNTDGITRSTTASGAGKSQHYSMHCGLFRNMSAGALPATVALPSINVEGNVGIIGSGSGFIVCGTLGGGSGVTTLDAVSGITLDGAYVSGASGSSFAPLLIANVDSNTVMNFTDVSSANYTSVQSSKGNSWYAATSLIGAVGKTDGSSRNMKPTFSEITLDSRKQDIAGADNSRFTAVYGSSRSIFKTATLLGHYYFSTASDTESKGIYNYTYAEDWDGSPDHNVTYGQEISSSQEYDGKQEKYNGDSHYTDPTSGSNTSAEYDFDPDYFLPYVGNYNSGNANYHELRVNHDTESLTEGCGTYNDPYVVDGDKLATVASILGGTMPPSTFNISLPDDGLTDKNASAVTAGTGDINLLWCTGSSFHHDYHWNGANFTNADDSKTYTQELVMAYLAGAYYVIEEDIEVSTGLSGSLAYTAFRGVIVGRQFTDNESVTRYPNVTLTTSSPFIPTSNGCVIKNLNFVVDSGVTVDLNQSLSPDTATDTFQYGGGCQSYGAVIGKIMGGDNIIDNVGVTFNWSDGAISSVSNAYIVPVGGYVGVVVNGGLFFRNMDLVPTAKKTGLTDAMFSGGDHIGDNNTTYLYHNPIIGRVINGYAVTEGGSYVPYSATQTLKNGTKNYAITDINKTECVNSSGVAHAKTLDVTASTINVPNDQAWFIMSCIVNSGTGSGSNTNLKMADNNISYSVTNYKPTHLGTYDDVGCGSYATKGKKDVNSVATSICDETVLFTANSFEMKNSADAVTPYIVYKYSTQSVVGANNFYKHYAKSLCGSARTIVMNPNGSGAVWTLPDGYRGIGGFNGSDNNNKNSTYNIKVSGMTCNGTTINLNMKYQTYLYSVTNSSYKQENYYPVDNGFGLFNTINISQEITVSNLTLKGSVYIDTYDCSTGEAFFGYGGDYNKNFALDCISATNGRVSAGMFAGQKTVNARLTLSNVALDSIDVHSSRAAGGMIGMANTVSMLSCPAVNIKVLGRYDTGGYVGQLKGISSISGTSPASKTGVSIDSVVQEAKGFNLKASSGRNSGVGGIVGRYFKKDNNDTLTIENLNITKYGGTDGKVSYPVDSRDECPVGGILGGCDTASTTVTIQNCDMTGVSVIGTQNRVGGVLGGTMNGPTVSIKNVVLDGDGSAVISVAAKDQLGGIIGYMQKGTKNVENVVLKSYTIDRDPSRAAATDPGKGYAGYGEGYIGGCIAMMEGGTLNIKDFYIDNVTFSGICREKGCGGIVGHSKGGVVHGYNVALNSLTSTLAVNNQPLKAAYGGDIAGTPASREFFIVGFSRQDTPTNTLYGGSTSASSYIIFSDYLGVGFDGDGNTSKPVFNGSEAANTVDANVPYATVNPVSSSGIAGHETILTGDGIAPSYNSSAIAAIKSDLAAGTERKRYTTVGTAVTNTITKSNFSTFNTEWGEDTVENDFIVLLVEDSNRANITALINNYIKALTNQTKYSNFGTDQSLIYKVNIYKMQYEEDGYFTQSDSGVHLHKDNGQFFMSSSDPNDVDSAEEKPTFSLIDVAFYDPTLTSSQKVAYHLYIPVYVKKMLNFSFSINTASNTPYYPTAYYDNNLIDNLGAAGSLYFTYSYNRKVEEWQHALEYGENLLVNYDKILTMTKKGDSTAHFDDDMLIALVDRNNGSKVYYATFGDVYNDGKLTLYENGSSSFTTSIGSGTQFDPVTICDMLNISAMQNNYGKFVRINPSLDGSYDYATVKIGGNYYRPVDSYPGSTDSSLGYAASNRYNLTVINRAGVDAPLAADNDLNITESYYLSLFTVESDNPSLINYYNITSTKKLTGGSSAAKATAEPGSAEILFGNLFTQSDVTYQANYNGSNPDLISDSNKTIKVRLETTIELTDTAMSEISGLIGAGSVYQSFLVYMTKREGGSTKAILGDPTAFAEVEISPVNLLSAIPPVSVGSAVYPFGAAFTKVGNSYVEVNSGENIAGFLADGGATIVSLVHINYETQDDRMAQFAARASNAESEQLKYTSVSAESKIGFNEDTVAYSTTKSEAARVGLDMRYYIIASKRPTLAYNAYADADSDVYGQLGINANDLPDATGKVGVRTKAVYDISNIRNEVTGYGYVKVTFELRQKRQRYFDEYGDPLPIRTYMKNVNVAGSSATYDPVVYNGASYVAAGNAAVIYSFIVPRNEVETADCILEIPINFSVFTGTDVTEGEAASFEGKGLMYSNYRITISCEMLEHANDENGFTTSYATNYIVYTNAKLLTTFIRIE